MALVKMLLGQFGGKVTLRDLDGDTVTRSVNGATAVAIMGDSRPNETVILDRLAGLECRIASKGTDSNGQSKSVVGLVKITKPVASKGKAQKASKPVATPATPATV